jgi:hypothetical protein
MRSLLGIVVLAAAMLATPALAQVRYQDAQGVVHYVQSLDMVPPQYRDGSTGRAIVPPTVAEREAIRRDERLRSAEATKSAREYDRRRAREKAQEEEQKAAKERAEAIKGAEHECAKAEGIEIVSGMSPSRQARVQCDEFYRRGGRARWHKELEPPR